MDSKEKITIKYHRHLEGDEPEHMVYFTTVDVHTCMRDYADAIQPEQLCKFYIWLKENRKKHTNLSNEKIIQLYLTNPCHPER